MGIQELQARNPVIGKIGLGRKKVTENGYTRPTSTEYFVLDRLPSDIRERIIEVYGPDPKTLDILFPSNNIDEIIPTFYAWYGGGTRGSDGEMLGGTLKCKGNGPTKEGIPGVAEYFDKKDLVTGIVPVRPCMGTKCPDHMGPGNRKQCQATMIVNCILPRITPYGIISITTKSWYSMRSFTDLLGWITRFGGSLAGQYFRLVRTEKNINYVENGKKKSSKQFIMELQPNFLFKEEHGEEVEELFKKCFSRATLNTALLQGNNKQISYSAEDFEDYEEDVGDDVVEEPQEVIAVTPEDVIKMPEVEEMFRKYEEASGKKFSTTGRLFAIRKLGNVPDLKQAALAAIATKIEEVKPKIVVETTVIEKPIESTPTSTDDAGLM